MKYIPSRPDCEKPLFMLMPILNRKRIGQRKLKPQQTWYSKDLGEYLLTYETVQKAPKPDEILLQLLESIYESAATKVTWKKKPWKKVLEIRSGYPLVENTRLPDV